MIIRMMDSLRSLPRRALSPWGIVLIATAVAGLVMRVWIYRSALGIPNSDEGVVGLMVRHAMHGDLSTFFWGSPYGGPQEVILTIPFMAVLGSGWLAVRVPPIALHAVACVLIWRVGLRTIGPLGAKVAAAIFWVWPPFVLFQLTQQQSFYATNVVYCALVVLLALRIVELPDRMRVGLFGFVLGFGFFQSPQIAPIAIPAIIWIIWRRREALRHAWLAALLAIVGASPWIVWNMRHGWGSLDVHGTLHQYLTSLRLLASPLGLETIGLRSPFTAEPFIPSVPITYLLFAALLGLFAYAGVRARREPAAVLFIVTAVFPFIYALGRMTANITGWPQYTVILTPVLALLIARIARNDLQGIALVALMFAITAVALPRMNAWIKLPQPIARAPRDFSPLIATLDRLHLGHVYADYWIAYNLDFDSDERIVAVENSFSAVSFPGGKAVPGYDENIRYRTYDRKVRAADRSGFVFFRRTLESVKIVPQLEQNGYRAVPVGPFVIYAPPG